MRHKIRTDKKGYVKMDHNSDLPPEDKTAFLMKNIVE